MDSPTFPAVGRNAATRRSPRGFLSRDRRVSHTINKGMALAFAGAMRISSHTPVGRWAASLLCCAVLLATGVHAATRLQGTSAESPTSPTGLTRPTSQAGALTASSELRLNSHLVAQTRLYHIIDLGLHGPAELNQHRQIAIKARLTLIGSQYYPQPFSAVWEDGNATELPTPSGHEQATAAGLNNRRDVVGWATYNPFPYNYGCPGCPVFGHALLWKHDGTRVTLPHLPASGTREAAIASYADAINDRGDIVGRSGYGVLGRGGWQKAVIWRDGTIVELGPAGNGLSGAANSINDAGDVVGWAQMTSFEWGPGPMRAFLWTGTMADLGSFGGASGTSIAYDINHSRTIAGMSSDAAGGTRAFMWQSGVMSDLGTLAGDTDAEAFAINTGGEIVGTSYKRLCTTCGRRAVVWRGGLVTDLNLQIPPGSGWVLNEAVDIDDQGRIVGRGMLNGNARNFFLDPAGVITGSPPAISDVANLTLDEDQTSDAVGFTIADADTDLGALTVIAESTNQTLIPNASLILGGSGGNRTITMTPAANKFGAATITLSVSDGTSTAVDVFTVTVTSVNDAPTISDMPDLTLAEDAPSTAVAFTMGDVDGNGDSLPVLAKSSNQKLVPNSSFSYRYNGPFSRSVVVTPAGNEYGTATITVSVSDGKSTAADTFLLTVTPVNDPPAITVPSNRTVPGGTTTIGPLPITVADIDTPMSSLVLQASSSKPSVVPNAGILFGGSGATRTVMVAPTPGAAGTATITVTVSDGIASASRGFALTVLESEPPPSPPSPPTGSTRPGAPSGLSARVRDARLVDLSWSPPAADVSSGDAQADAAIVTGYHVEVGTSSGSAGAATFTTGVTTSFTIEGLRPGRYFVRVRATSDAGMSDPSNEASVTLDDTPPPCLLPTAPRLAGAVNGTIVELSWTRGPSDVATQYLLHVGTSAGRSDVFFTFGASTGSASAPAPNGTWFFRVVAHNACGVSEDSNEVSLTVGPPPPPAPGAPANPVADVAGSRVTLSWMPPVTGGAASRYIIDAFDLAGNLLASIDTGNASTTFTYGNAGSGTYALRVRGANAGGIGPASGVIIVIVP